MAAEPIDLGVLHLNAEERPALLLHVHERLHKLGFGKMADIMLPPMVSIAIQNDASKNEAWEKLLAMLTSEERDALVDSLLHVSVDAVFHPERYES